MTHFARLNLFTFAGINGSFGFAVMAGIVVIVVMASLILAPQSLTLATLAHAQSRSQPESTRADSPSSETAVTRTDEPAARDRATSDDDDTKSDEAKAQDTNVDPDVEDVENADDVDDADSDLDQVTPFMDPRGDPMRRRDAQSTEPMTDQDIRDVIAVLEDINPTLAQRLRTALRNNPDRARHMLTAARDRIRLLIEARRNDPRLYDLRVRDFRLTQRTSMTARRVRQIRDQGNRREIAQASARLRQLLIEHFEVRQAMRAHELKRLEARLTEMRRQLEQQSRERDALIDRRLREMLTDDAPPAR